MQLDKISPQLSWQVLGAGDVPGVAALAARCLAVDGGLPLAAAESFVAGRYAAEGAVAYGCTSADGILLASAAVRPHGSAGVRRAVATGQVDPAWRGRGHGARLLDWCLATAAGMAEDSAAVTVETESLTGAAADLFSSRGLHQVFAEDVMRFDLPGTPLPDAPLPAGATLAEWTPELAARFFAVYEAAFRDRPGFPGWTAEQWIDWISDDEDFRPQWSLLAVDGDGTDVGFVACGKGWVVQVGVRPDRRGRRLGAALVVEALRRMHAAGESEALLDVNVDNPAGELYRRLGFSVVGRRARFSPS